jgi:hypothetical protein
MNLTPSMTPLSGVGIYHGLTLWDCDEKDN